MKFSELKIGMLLKSEKHKLSYLIYEKTESDVSLFEITPKAKYLPWDKIGNDEWDSDTYDLWRNLDVSYNRFDMHDAIDVVFTRITKLE